MYSEMWLRTTGLQHLNSIQDQSAQVYFKQFKNLGLLLSHALISSFTIKLQKNIYTNTIEMQKRNLNATALTQISQESTVPNMAL